jgi:hypothetical protein
VNALRRALELGTAQAFEREPMAVDLGTHAPRVRRQQRDAVADHQRFFDGVRDEQQREAHLVPQLEQFLLHLAARERIERGEGLVHQQHARLHGQRAGDGHALLHAAGELVRMHVGEPGQAHLVEVVQRAFGGFLLAERARREQREHDVLLDRFPWRQLVEFLEHDDAVGAGLGHALAVETDLAFDRRDETGHGLQQRRLAAARGAEQHEAVGGVNVEAHAVGGANDAFGGAVFEADAVDLEQRREVVLPPLPLAGEGWGEGWWRCQRLPPHPRPLPMGEGVNPGARWPRCSSISSPNCSARRRRSSPSPTPACS